MTNLVPDGTTDPTYSSSQPPDAWPQVPSLPPLFSSPAAAEILRGIGLTEITACALRTRAYRRQVPFHLNGRRIVFTLSDLKEIAEGGAYRPASADRAPSPSPHPTVHGDPVHPEARVHLSGWRARHLHQPQSEEEQPTPPTHGRHPRHGAIRNSHGA